MFWEIVFWGFAVGSGFLLFMYIYATSMLRYIHLQKDEFWNSQNIGFHHPQTQQHYD